MSLDSNIQSFADLYILVVQSYMTALQQSINFAKTIPNAIIAKPIVSLVSTIKQTINIQNFAMKRTVAIHASNDIAFKNFAIAKMTIQK